MVIHTRYFLFALFTIIDIHTFIHSWNVLILNTFYSLRPGGGIVASYEHPMGAYNQTWDSWKSIKKKISRHLNLLFHMNGQPELTSKMNLITREVNKNREFEKPLHVSKGPLRGPRGGWIWSIMIKQRVNKKSTLFQQGARTIWW